MVLHLMMIHETSCTKIIYNSLNTPDKYAAFGAAADDSRTISSKFDSVDARGVRATDGEEREASSSRSSSSFASSQVGASSKSFTTGSALPPATARRSAFELGDDQSSLEYNDNDVTSLVSFASISRVGSPFLASQKVIFLSEDAVTKIESSTG